MDYDPGALDLISHCYGARLARKQYSALTLKGVFHSLSNICHRLLEFDIPERKGFSQLSRILPVREFIDQTALTS